MNIGNYNAVTWDNINNYSTLAMHGLTSNARFFESNGWDTKRLAEQSFRMGKDMEEERLRQKDAFHKASDLPS